MSANPTGPLTVGNARGAFVGDLLSRVLEAVGHEVTREYYFNDFNAQVRNLGLSVLARHEGREVPEDGYHGDYVNELAAQVPDELWQQAAAPDADPGEVLGRWASERVRAGIEASLAALGVRFDVWKSEGSLHAEGWVERALDQLRATGDIYEADGATWFRATAYGDDKDRVVIRSNGQPTYFASDIGYLAEKFSRGFDELIYLWGEDHHGTVARNRAAAQALGFKAGARAVPADGLGALRARRTGDRHEQARRRVRQPGRAAGRDRRRCRALVLRLTRADHRHRLRHRAGQEAERREPGLLRPVRACPLLVHPAQRAWPRA